MHHRVGLRGGFNALRVLLEQCCASPFLLQESWISLRAGFRLQLGLYDGGGVYDMPPGELD